MRLFLKILSIIVVIILLVAAYRLLPAHLQVRGVEPELPRTEELAELMSMENGPVSVRYINTSSQNLPGGVLGHTVFLIEWANGNLLMIDAGMDRAQAIEFGRLMESALGADEAVSHGTIAELLGDDLHRVSAVAFTHLHIDHTQGVVPFCQERGDGATVYQTSWQIELQNFNTTAGADLIANSCLARGEPDGEVVKTIPGYPGLGIVALGGHTPGSTLFAIASQNRLWLLSGDTTNTRADLLSNTGKGFLYSYVLVPENTSRIEALRRWLADLDNNPDMTVIVSHDLGAVKASGMEPYGH